MLCVYWAAVIQLENNNRGQAVGREGMVGVEGMG